MTGSAFKASATGNETANPKKALGPRPHKLSVSAGDLKTQLWALGSILEPPLSPGS